MMRSLVEEFLVLQEGVTIESLRVWLHHAHRRPDQELVLAARAAITVEALIAIIEHMPFEGTKDRFAQAREIARGILEEQRDDVVASMVREMN